MPQPTIGADIQEAIRWLEAGHLVAIPTETVYGLAANALDPDAVARIFEVKRRPHFNPLIVHVRDWAQAQAFIENPPALARLLAGAFWPGPLTLLLPKNGTIPDLVTAGSPLVAVRAPRHPLTRALLQALPFPLAAPSANPFGYISPTTAGHVARQLGDSIPYILDGGPSEVGLESTIVGFEQNGPALYRLGGLNLEEIEAVCGPLADARARTDKPAAAGMLKSHYAPRTPLYLDQTLDGLPARTGRLQFRGLAPDTPAEWQRVLSFSSDLREAARNLFGYLHELDALGLDAILAERLPAIGLGPAINDRLERAQAIFKNQPED